MRKELDELGLVITAKRQHLQERGLFDAETRAVATGLQAAQLAIAANLETIDIGERAPHARSMTAKEIGALAERFRLWSDRPEVPK